MPKKEIIHLSPAAPNPNLSPATRFGNLVFVSGQTGRHPVSGEVGKDIREQTRNILERIKQILTAAGTSMDNVLTATTYVTRREDVPAYNEEYAKYFPSNKPARTTVTVASLNSTDPSPTTAPRKVTWPVTLPREGSPLQPDARTQQTRAAEMDRIMTTPFLCRGRLEHRDCKHRKIQNPSMTLPSSRSASRFSVVISTAKKLLGGESFGSLKPKSPVANV